MHQAIEALLQLQTIHIELDQVNEILSHVPEKLQEVYDKQQQSEEELAALETELIELDAQIAKLTVENEEESDRVRSYDKRLKQIKTNRDYQGLLREVGYSRKLVVESDNELRAKNARREVVALQCENLKTLLEQLKQQGMSVQQEWTGGQTDLTGRREQLSQAEKDTAQRVGRDALSRYGLVRKRLKVVVVKAQSGRCTGCNMALPPQHYNRLLRGHEIISCPSCSRILYVEAAAAAAPVQPA